MIQNSVQTTQDNTDLQNRRQSIIHTVQDNTDIQKDEKVLFILPKTTQTYKKTRKYCSYYPRQHRHTKRRESIVHTTQDNTDYKKTSSKNCGSICSHCPGQCRQTNRRERICSHYPGQHRHTDRRERLYSSCTGEQNTWKDKISLFIFYRSTRTLKKKTYFISPV